MSFRPVLWPERAIVKHSRKVYEELRKQYEKEMDSVSGPTDDSDFRRD